MQELEAGVLGQIHAFACWLCLAIFLVAEAASPLIAAFFRSEQLLAVLLANNVTFLITGFQQVPLALLQREMDYRRLSISEGVMALTQAIATVAAAVAGLKYWSLVIGAILGKTTGAALNYY
jgi:PST family polysaccharide transporter